MISRSVPRSFQIKCLDPDAFSLHSVVSDPRSARPYDVKAACNNISVSAAGKRPPIDVMSLVSYLLGGYFELAHRTGLYNRQRQMWEALARITSANVQVVRSGGLVPLKVPAFDIEFANNNNDLLIVARLVKPQKRKDFDRRSLVYTKSFIARLSKIKVKHRSLCGAFICLPAPISRLVVDKVESLFAKDDPVARYESRLPPPTDIAFDVLEMAYPQASQIEDTFENASDCRFLYPDGQLFSVRLIHPRFPERR